MTGEVQIILLILSSIFGYLARMKIKAKCGCCEVEIERDDNNKVKRVSVVKKEKSQRNLDPSIDTNSENTPRSKKNQQSGVL